MSITAAMTTQMTFRRCRAKKPSRRALCVPGASASVVTSSPDRRFTSDRRWHAHRPSVRSAFQDHGERPVVDQIHLHVRSENAPFDVGTQVLQLGAEAIVNGFGHIPGGRLGPGRTAALAGIAVKGELADHQQRCAGLLAGLFIGQDPQPEDFGRQLLGDLVGVGVRDPEQDRQSRTDLGDGLVVHGDAGAGDSLDNGSHSDRIRVAAAGGRLAAWPSTYPMTCIRSSSHWHGYWVIGTVTARETIPRSRRSITNKTSFLLTTADRFCIISAVRGSPTITVNACGRAPWKPVLSGRGRCRKTGQTKERWIWNWCWRIRPVMPRCGTAGPKARASI